MAETPGTLRRWWPSPVPGLLPLLLLAGCGTPAPTGTAPPPPPPVAPAEAAVVNRSAPATVPAALVPLPTPQQVVTAVPVGRRDPFAPLLTPTAQTAFGEPGASGPAGRGRGLAGRPGVLLLPLRLPDDFRVTGVIHTGGRSEAVVQYGGQSGSLRPGDLGGATTDLLPSGWSVAAIDVQRGHLTLQSGRQRVTAEL